MKLPSVTPCRGISLFLILSLFCGSLPVEAQIKPGNSYINLSKKKVGGAVQPGDTLEIRTNYYFTAGFNSNEIYYVRYLDNLPTKTAFVSDSIRLVTNEGLTYKRFTPALSDDAGSYQASPAAGNYHVRLNMGRNATAPNSAHSLASTTGAGTIYTGGALKDKPLVGGSRLLISTSFKVRVTGIINDTITLGAGVFVYKATNSSGAADVILTTTQYKILISNNDPICPNATGANFVGEAGGTFDSGVAQNRSYPPTFLIPSYTYTPISSATALNDGKYAVVNNLSPWRSTFRNANKRPVCTVPAGGPPPAAASCDNRMFGGYWDIIGDHTGSTTPAGNNPVNGTRGGYMLVVNADYNTTEAYKQTISGLCSNTAYEFSVWVRNVCSVCGVDSLGAQTYKPGVYPNLSFAVNGLDRYSSGQIDTSGWVKKGFLFQTGASQTSITISIRNNASGGGGNDWAIDDIALVSCSPNLNLVPSGDAAVCYGSQVDIGSTVTSYFNNYTYYRFERSTDNGLTWTIPGSGTGSPAPVSNGYEYLTALPPFLADSAHHLNQYRFVVATSASNLSNPGCSFVASTRLIVMVNNCSVILNDPLLSLKGTLSGHHAALTWFNNREAENTVYQIEKSIDGRIFYAIGSKNGRGGGGEVRYNFTDPVAISGPVYYRIQARSLNTNQYSKTIGLTNSGEAGIRGLINPFRDKINFDIQAIATGQAEISVVDNFGKPIHRSTVKTRKGINPVIINTPGNITPGVYYLRLRIGDQLINRILVKKN